MLESPLIQELVDKQLHHVVVENRREDILDFLESRFGEVPADLAEQIRSLADERRLRDLVRKAGSCADLDAFRKELP